MSIINKKDIQNIKGPILIIGAAGFLGFNFLSKFLQTRNDVYGIVRRKNSWRLKNFKNKSNLIICDITNKNSIEKVIKTIRPQTIINCSAYGAYSSQYNLERIYKVNFLSTLNILEILSKQKFSTYLHCGSSSEYGFNCSAPKESDKLLPDSHYAVSKAAVANLISYYGKKEKQPVVHLRLYSVYGPWEEPTRLIPQIIANGLEGKLPSLVDGKISRDFIYIDDVISAFVCVAKNIKMKNWGEIYNIGTGVKTTIKQLANLTQTIYAIEDKIKFGSMKKKVWDLTDWYANNQKMKLDFHWQYSVKLDQGLILFTDWYKEHKKLYKK